MAAERKPDFFGQRHQNRNHRVRVRRAAASAAVWDVGQRVTGFDLDKTKVEKLNAGQSNKRAGYIQAYLKRATQSSHREPC